MAKNCILCNGSHLHERDKVNFHDLSRLYKISLEVDIELSEKCDDIILYKCGECDLLFYSPAPCGDDKFYARLQKFDWYYLNDKLEYDIAADFVRTPGNVLEIGCGKGAFSKKIKSLRYVGLELSDVTAQMGRSDGVEILSESVEEHARKNPEHYDVVCFFQVLEHVPEPRIFLESALACLKPGGRLIVSVPSEDSFLSITENNILNMPPHHLTRWTDKTLLSISNLVGLKLVALEHETVSDIHLRWYVASVVQNAFKKCLGLKRHLLDRSLFNRSLCFLSSFVARFLVSGFNAKSLLPRGHSVVAVFEKNKGAKVCCAFVI